MKSYIELNDEEKKQLEELINEVRLLLPDYLELFSSEKLDSSNNIVLKTKQDYDNDKNLLLRLIEDKRKDGFINKEKSKELKKAVIVLFTEFIRISPKKSIEIKEEEPLKDVIEEVSDSGKDEHEYRSVNGLKMNVGELYALVHGTYIKIPEKILYRLVDIPGDEERQRLQYFITNDDEIDFIREDDIKIIK